MSYTINALTKSLNVFHLAGSACNNCDIEILDALTPRYDLERFGITLVGSIRHADVILLSGIFNKKARLRMLEVLAQAPRPYLVVAIGGCPASGLMFKDSYNYYAAPADYVPIDAFIPGCPPKPEAIISGVVTVIGALREGLMVPKCLTEEVATHVAPTGAGSTVGATSVATPEGDPVVGATSVATPEGDPVVGATSVATPEAAT